MYERDTYEVRRDVLGPTQAAANHYLQRRVRGVKPPSALANVPPEV
jgi:hypothetical protein